MVTGAPKDPPAGRVVTSPNRSLFFLIQPTTAAPDELTATDTWRTALADGAARVAGCGPRPCRRASGTGHADDPGHIDLRPRGQDVPVSVGGDLHGACEQQAGAAHHGRRGPSSGCGPDRGLNH